MKNIFLIRNTVLAAIVLISCNSNPKQSNVVAPLTPVKPVTITEPASCYALLKNKDKVVLHVTINDNKVTGDLAYNYFEKDRSSGTINGEMKGDTLYAVYTFMSEGKESDRQVVFLKKGDEFTEGYGKINTATGVADLTDKSAINFDGNSVLKKTDCGKDDHGCIGLSGLSWSVLKNNCIDLSATAIRLNPIEMKDKDKAPAYIIFSADQTQAELYLPENKISVMLSRKGKEGNWSWENEDLKLIQWKGYVLKKGSLAIYGGI